MTLVIRASENSWISVTADGQPVSQETLIAPAHTSIRASREIVVKAGNAAGVSFLWNGKEIAAEGGEAEVKTFVFDSGGMRVVSTAQPATQNP
jgi:cytoskeleton protein RodZ